MKPPEYVMFKDKEGKLHTAMYLDVDSYVRVAGSWSCGFIVKDDKLIAQIPSHPGIHNAELVGVTEAEWRKDNEGYCD